MADPWSYFPAPLNLSAPDAIYSGETWIFYGMDHVAEQIIQFAAEQRVPFSPVTSV